MQSDSAGRGRPRDPEIEQRVYRAARTVFAERGWVGFGLTHVAREAGVGKSALYLRWESPEELLLEALEDHAAGVRLGFTDDFRTNLVHLGAHLLIAYSQPGGLAAMRMFVEARAQPELYARFRARVVDPTLHQLYRIVDAAVAAHEIPHQDARELTNLVHGAALSRAMIDYGAEDPMSPNAARDYATHLVDRLLAGMRAEQIGH